MKFVFHGHEDKAGIYKIWNMTTGKFYIGATDLFSKRAIEHERRLSTGKHHNRHLQHSFNKYGTDRFEFEAVEVTDVEDRSDAEQRHFDFWIDLDLWNMTYNIYKKAVVFNKSVFSKTPQETRAKMSRANKGKFVSEETKAKIRASRLGTKQSEASKALNAIASSKTYLMLDLNTNKEFLVTNLTQWCKDNGYCTPTCIKRSKNGYRGFKYIRKVEN